MKKISYLFILIIAIFSNCITTLATTKPNQPIFSITSGLEKDKSTSTFDKSTNIVGSANVGSSISIKVYEKLPDKKEKLNLLDTYSIIVGSTGYFSENINLAIGENIIQIDVTKNKQTYSLTATINRKKSEIKNELEHNPIANRARR